ncbi:MAG: hypothetical protein ACKVQA_02415 [Burkholderiales bacterium]
MNDTSPEIGRMVRDRYAAMSPQERVRIGAEMFDTARSIVIASFPPNLTEKERRRMLCQRFYGDLFDEAFR